jgi:hypothetical protein
MTHRETARRLFDAATADAGPLASEIEELAKLIDEGAPVREVERQTISIRLLCAAFEIEFAAIHPRLTEALCYMHLARIAEEEASKLD